jgi:hypothetical protein
MAWPRDADRLPNDHTLVGDTNSGRVFEIDETGVVVWQVNGLPSYDVERLGTDDGSTDPRPAARIDLPDSSPESESVGPPRSVVPAKVRNTVAFVAPLWMSGSVQAVALLGLGSALTFALLVLAGGVRRLRAAKR